MHLSIVAMMHGGTLDSPSRQNIIYEMNDDKLQMMMLNWHVQM